MYVLYFLYDRQNSIIELSDNAHGMTAQVPCQPGMTADEMHLFAEIG